MGINCYTTSLKLSLARSKKATLLNCLSHGEMEDLLRVVASDQHPSQKRGIAKLKRD